MKKTLLILTAVTGLSLTSKAQEIEGLQKGNIIIEGSFQANAKDNKNLSSKSSLYGFNPKVGVFLTDKIAVGLKLNLGKETEETYHKSLSTLPKKMSTNVFGIGAFGRYYFLEVGSRFKTYADINVDYLTSRDQTTIINNTTKGPKLDGFGINAGIGANYFLTNSIAVNFSFANVIGYNTLKLKTDDSKSINSFNGKMVK